MAQNFGEFIYELRKENRMTQTELADKLDITNKAVSKWETGEAFPETALLVPLANIFGITVDELLRGEKDSVKDAERAEEKKVLAEIPKLKQIDMKETIGIVTALALILAGVLVLITLSVNDLSYGIYLPILFACIAVAVFLFISMGTRRSLRSVEIDEANLKKGKISAFLTALGVGLIILALIPLIAMEAFEISSKIYLPVFLSLEFVSICILVFGSIMWDNFSKSFKLPKDDQLPEKYEQLNGSVCGIIMLVATVIFLILGFVFDMWHPGWVVYPVGGVLCGVSTMIFGIVAKKNAE